MKKRITYFTLASISITFLALSTHMMNGNVLIRENAEALSASEGSAGSTKGRWKTVACYGFNYSDWRTFCCPSDYWDNCNGRIGTCPRMPYDGCQDTFVYKNEDNK